MNELPKYKPKELKKLPESVSCPQLLSQQVNHEFNNSLFYQCCQDFCDREGLFKASAYYDKLATEERGHGLLILKFMQGKDYKFDGFQLDGCNPTFTSLIDVMQQAYEKEVSTTKALKQIRDHAVSDNEPLTEMLMIDMLKEQIEEEASAKDLLAKAKGLNPENKLDMLHLEEQF